MIQEDWWSGAVADPGFSRGGGVNPPGGAWTRQIFPKTAWNRKNLDAQGGRASLTPPRSANVECCTLQTSQLKRLMFALWQFEGCIMKMNGSCMPAVEFEFITQVSWKPPPILFWQWPTRKTAIGGGFFRSATVGRQQKLSSKHRWWTQTLPQLF